MIYPFTELRIQWLNESQFTIDLPWIKVQAKCDPSDLARVKKAEDAFANGYGFEDADVQWFLQQFAQLPIGYSLPRCLDVDDRSKNYLFSPRHLDRVFRENEIIEMSRDVSSEYIDPLTFLAILRRERLTSRIDNPYKQNVLKFLKSARSGAIDKNFLIKTFLTQNHHITEICRQALTPALAIAGDARDDLQDFIKAETGHDLLLLDSLNNLKTEVQPPVLEGIFELAELLQKTATESFLGICALIDYFEEGGDSNPHPLDEAILSLGLEQECRGFFIHKRINLEGHHNNIAHDLLKNAQGFTVAEARYVLDVCDKVMDLENQTSFEMLGLLTRAAKIQVEDDIAEAS